MLKHELIVQHMGLAPYLPTWHAMRDFTMQRTPDDSDQLWLLEHPSVFTQGYAGKAEHLLQHPHHIPVIPTDRGGQITYHAPGQLVAYCLFNVRRLQLAASSLVRALENIMLELLLHWRIKAQTRPGAPGIYIDAAKIGSLGLRIRRGCSYHGLALNVDMDLKPFTWINPCGHEGMSVTQLKDHGVPAAVPEVAAVLTDHLQATFNYTTIKTLDSR